MTDRRLYLIFLGMILVGLPMSLIPLWVGGDPIIAVSGIGGGLTGLGAGLIIVMRLSR